MSDPWNFSGESVALGPPGGTVTLVEGSAFCISGRSGDMSPGSPQGLFFRDMRVLSHLELKVNGHCPEPLSCTPTDPFVAVFVARTRPRVGRADSTMLIFRHRYIGRGMREDVRIRNFGDEAAYCSIEITFDADFADLFDVKEGRIVRHGEHAVETSEDAITFRHRRRNVRRGLHVTFSEPAQLTGNVAMFEVVVPAHGDWSTCVQFTPSIEDEQIRPRYCCGESVERATPAERLQKWRREIPSVETDNATLGAVVRRSAEDLGALRIFDPDHPERAVVAAGAPWFMALFGRDSLIAAWMALIVDPDLALGVLQTLARFQGTKVDPRNDEEPGRILHEIRFGEAIGLSLGGGRMYYGSADSTPLFVMLLGELRRWGLAREIVDQLLPNADRAIEWMDSFGDRDGDGFIEYKRASDRGLANQGWKDSWDGIRFAGGDVAKAPIALCEVQAYAYAAYLARAHFAWEAGDVATWERLRARAYDLKERFNDQFWLDDRGWFAVGLDHRKQPIDSLTSNIGHCLWTGIVDEDKAARVAARLVSPEMFSGWGVRTLASSMGGYNPISYHCGSVWPHDSAIAAAGLMRYGFVAEAQQVILGLLDASETQDHRLPELFSGLDRTDFPLVVSYPTSCSPQAWSAASALLFLRTLLRFDPWVPRGKVWVSPALPERIRSLRVDRIPLAGRRVSVAIDQDAGTFKVDGLPPEIELITEPRHPLTAADRV